MSDHGSRKPLNWQNPTFDQPVKKSVSHEEKLDVHSRSGTPPTRRGSFNGAPSGLKPALTTELNPPLVLNKAVRAPVQYDAEGKAQFARKRGHDGKFVEQEDTGTESTASDDAAKQERSSRLQQHKMNDKLVDAKQRASQVSRGETPKNPSVKDNHEEDGRVDKALGGNQVPGMPSAVPMDNVNDPVSKQIGVASQSGAPIYDDPHHSEHADFTPQDHQDAAMANQNAASSAAAQGDQAGAMRFNNNAMTHQSMGSDTSNPSTRFLDQLTTQNGQAPLMDDLPQDDLSALMGADPSGAPGSFQQPGQPPMGASPLEQTPPAPPVMAGASPEAMMPQAPQPDMAAPAVPPPPAPQDPMAPPASAQSADPMGQAVPGPQPDALSAFVDPGADQNKPTMTPAMPGPAPGMVNNQTGTGVGPQTSLQQFAGTMQQPVPPAGDSSPVPPMGDMSAPPAPDMGADPMAEDPNSDGHDPTDDGSSALDLDSLFGSDSEESDDAAPFGQDAAEGEPEGSDEDPEAGGESSDGNPFAEKDEAPPEDKEKVDAAVEKALRALSRLL